MSLRKIALQMTAKLASDSQVVLPRIALFSAAFSQKPKDCDTIWRVM